MWPIGSAPRRGAKLTVAATELGGQRFAQVVHTQRVALSGVDKRLKGVTVDAPVPVLVGNSGGRAALMGPDAGGRLDRT